MTIVECPRERDVVHAVLTDRVLGGDDLWSHAQGCVVCREAVTVATALRSWRDETLHEARVPAAGQVWWRAALRAHAEAVRAARRPIVWLQGVAGACAAGVIAGLTSLAWPAIQEAAAIVAALPPALGQDVGPLVETMRPAMPLALAALAGLVLAPLAVYLALSDE